MYSLNLKDALANVRGARKRKKIRRGSFRGILKARSSKHGARDINRGMEGGGGHDSQCCFPISFPGNFRNPPR